MKTLLPLACAFVMLILCAGCGPSTAETSQFDADLATIRSGYRECVNDLGADSAQCKTLADGVHSVADQIGTTQNTAGRIKAEDQARRSMGY